MMERGSLLAKLACPSQPQPQGDSKDVEENICPFSHSPHLPFLSTLGSLRAGKWKKIPEGELHQLSSTLEGCKRHKGFAERFPTFYQYRLRAIEKDRSLAWEKQDIGW